MARHKHPSPHIPPPAVDPLDRIRFPLDPWRLVETDFNVDDAGVTETLFAVANGYLGMRGNPAEGRDTHTHGTFVNGFHETFSIRHAEDAYGLARVGQTIVNVPDSKTMKIYVDDEPLLLSAAELDHYERSLDMASGVLTRELIWRTPGNKRLRITTTRMVSMTERHVAVMTMRLEMLEGDAPVIISSQILNRQDGTDEYHVRSAAMGEGSESDPRKAEGFDRRVLEPQLSTVENGRTLLGYRTAESRMTIAVGAEHHLITDNEWAEDVVADDDQAKHVFRVQAVEGSVIELTKKVAYHTSRGVPVRELADRCRRTLDRITDTDSATLHAQQLEWFDEYWRHADVQVHDQPAVQQAVRWNLFQLAQAAGRADGFGVPAKGVTGSGYGGHYFWDTEVYVLPFLTYTYPRAARSALRFRYMMLSAARERATDVSQLGALFPWRTINGKEASAYFAAGTAQYHINADIAYALWKYARATGDTAFLLDEGVDILVETARLWVDLGFWQRNGEESFHIHGVTGPDEYTTVVNDNLFTNIMAKHNLRTAVEAVRTLAEVEPEEYARAVHRLGLSEEEIADWQRVSEGMSVPYDDALEVHPQDQHFLEREVWDLDHTPDDKRPLLLHYHPLVIYRFQVLKQADVVLAMYLAGDEFTLEEKRANFEYYDPITTGDSTLSAVVQSIVAAEVGYHEMALRYFYAGLFVDLDDRHGNATEGVHVASTGGVWSALVGGFGGMRDYHGILSFDPRLPASWEGLTYRLMWQENLLEVDLRQDRLRLQVLDGGDVEVEVRGEAVRVGSEVVEVPLAGQGPRTDGILPSTPHLGGRSADGTRLHLKVPASREDA